MTRVDFTLASCGLPITAQAAQLLAAHLVLLSRVDVVASELEAGMPLADAVAELRVMARTAREGGRS